MSKALAASVPRAPLCFSALAAGGALGASGVICVATAMPLETATPPRLEAIREDSVSTDTGRVPPMRFNCSTTRSGSTIGAPVEEVLASMCTLLSPDDRGSISSIIFVAVSDPDSPQLNLKLSERLKPEPKETSLLVACGVGVQDVWPAFSPRVPKTKRGYPGFMILSSNRILSPESSPRRATNFWIFSGMRLPLPKREVCTSSEKLRWTSRSAPCGLTSTFPVLSSRKKGTDKLSSNTCSHLWSFPEPTHCQAFTR